MPTNEKRFVLDTSTLIIAALNKRGKPRKAVVYAARNGLLLASYETFDELETRLKRPKFAPYLHEEDRDVFINWMYGLTSFIPILSPAQFLEWVQPSS